MYSSPGRAINWTHEHIRLLHYILCFVVYCTNRHLQNTHATSPCYVFYVLRQKHELNVKHVYDIEDG